MLASLQDRKQADLLLQSVYVDETGRTAVFTQKVSIKIRKTSFQWRFNLAGPDCAIIQQLSSKHRLPAVLITGPIRCLSKAAILTIFKPRHQPLDPAVVSKAANAKIIQGTGHWLHAEKPTRHLAKLCSDFLLR